MKILYDHRAFERQVFGGVSRYFYELVRNVVSVGEGEKLHVFQGIHVNAYPLSSYKSYFGRYFGIRHRALPKTRRLFSHVNEGLFSLFTKGSYGSHDIYHPTYYADSISRWKASPVVLTVHDMILELLQKSIRGRDRLILQKARSIQRADLLIAISEATKRDLIEFYGVEQSRIRVIYLGAPTEVMSSSCGNTQRYGKPFILYVGTRSGYKNFRLFLSAYASSERLKKNFDLVCFGGGSFSKEELRMIKEAQCERKVLNVDGDDKLLFETYRNAALFVYPSLYEGFGIPLLEAFACECPVVASDRGSIPEVGGDAVFYCNPDDLDSIRSSMETVVFDSGLSRQLVDKGRLRKKRFSWCDMARKMVQVYKEVSG